jgi:hypothetical protein
MTVRERILCRGCGGWGYEEPDDPCPGLCPRCFNDLLHDQLARYLDDLDDAHLTDARVADRLHERLVAAGLTDAARLRIEGRVRAQMR